MDAMTIDDNAPLPKGAIETLPVRARHVLENMAFPKTYGGIRGVTYEQVLAERNSGVKTARQVMEFREACLNGTIAPERPVAIPRIEDDLPPLALVNLSVRTRNILAKYGVEKTPRGVCALDRARIREFEGAGRLVADELMALKARCLDGTVWEDEVEAVVEEAIRPEQFGSFAEYVLAVAAKTCRSFDERRGKILADYLGLLNVEEVKTLDALGTECGVTRARVQQIAAKLERELFSEQGRAIFAEFVHCVETIFSQGRGILGTGDLAAGLEAILPWTGTTEFSVLKLLAYCGVEVEANASGFMAWMTGGDVEDRYETYLGLLDDADVPLEDLTQEAVLRDADQLGLDEITEGEYRFLVQRVFDRNKGRLWGEDKARWCLFLRLRCGLDPSEAERRRYAVARALRAIGLKGATREELAEACRAIDSSVGDLTDRQLDSDANPQLKYDMDGTGARLMIYDFGDRTHEKRYALDVFFRDDELLRVIRAAGDRLRRHMERNGLGAANITRLRKNIQKELPEKYADGLPSACVYWLMRENGVSGFKYYDHPNVAHPDILDASGRVPEQAISWLVYEYFLMAGHETATWAQLLDFCEVMLGMDGVIAAATVLPAIWGGKVVVDGVEQCALKAPTDTDDPPNLLLEGGEFDSELSFCVPRNPLGMEFDADGRARNMNTYVRAFLYELGKSGYAFTEDEERELADAGWCEAHLGIVKSAFIRAAPGSKRPNHSYWKVTYSVGGVEYWVSQYWRETYKSRFDAWAVDLAARAGFAFEPYEIPLEG